MAVTGQATASLIIARNDLEAVWLAALACRAGVDVIAFDDLRWGGVMPLADPRLSDLADTVLIAELPSPAFEQWLRDRGHQVHVLDHHVWTMPDGTMLDRSAPLSTLEQALRMMPALDGIHMSGKLGTTGVSALVAANDRGFIPGLTVAASALAPGNHASAMGWTNAVRFLDLAMRLGASPDMAERALDELAELDADQGTEAPAVAENCLGEVAETVRDALSAAIEFLARAKEENRLIHARSRQGADQAGVWVVNAPESHGPVLMDALYTYLADGAFDLMQVIREVVAIIHAATPEQQVSRVEFSGRSERRGMIDELMAVQAKLLPPSAVQYGGGSNETCFYGAVFPPSQGTDAVADCLLRNLLIDERFVAGWRTHFLQAFVLPAEWERGESLRHLPSHWHSETPSTSFMHYLAPHLRPVLAPTGSLEDDDVLASFRWNDPGYTLAVETNGATLEAVVSSLRLHVFHGHAVLIEWSVEATFEDGLVDDAVPLWRRLLDTGRRTRWTLGDLLDFNAYARFTTSTFPGPETVLRRDGKEVARLIRGPEPSPHPVDGWFRLLLDRVLNDFSVPNRVEVEPLYDERARVVASVVLAGAMPDLAAGQAALAPRLARLMVVDPSGAGWSADPDFAAQELAAGRYSRFDRYGAGTVYCVTGHSFAAVSGGEGFFAKLLHETHMPTIYRRLFILILFYGVNLSHYARLLTIADIDKGQGAYISLSNRYSRFSNNLWFETVSTQIQGMELFQLMRRQSNIADEIRQVEHEIETSSRILAHRAGQSTERFQRHMAWLGLLIATLVIVIGGPGLVTGLIEPWLETPAENRGWWPPFAAFVGCAAFAGCAAAALWHLLLGSPGQGTERD